MVAWILDLDGVIWLADQPIPGAAEAVAALRRAGEQIAFVTNNSFPRVRDVEQKLAAHGIPAEGAVVTSAMAAASLVEPGERVLACGGPGMTEALEHRGADIVHEGPADVVMVGFHRDFDWDRMRIAAAAVRAGARFVATNTDATYPTPDGPVPGAGAIVASIGTASGEQPVIAGKPHEAVAAVVRARFGSTGTVVGDRPETDGLFARTLGYRFALVLTGVTAEGDLPVEPTPDEIAPSLRDLVADHPSTERT